MGGSIHSRARDARFPFSGAAMVLALRSGEMGDPVPDG
jgi:hypothetical protein